LDRVQRAHAVEGHLFEIGAYFAKSAILLGHLARAPRERLLVDDAFERPEWLDEESSQELAQPHPDLGQQGFLEQFARFHAQPPSFVGTSTQLDVQGLTGACRLVHIDRGDHHDVVLHDARTAKRLLGDGGIVAVGGLSAPHRPGTALDTWEEVLDTDTFLPLVMTDTKLYGTWDPEVAHWMAGIDEWAETTSDIAIETVMRSGHKVRRVVELEQSRPPAENLIALPSLEELQSLVYRASSPPSLAAPPPQREGMARRVARRVVPPVAADWYRKRKPPGG
jgi:hypothetical protein